MLRYPTATLMGLLLIVGVVVGLTLTLGRGQCQIPTRYDALTADDTYRDRHAHFPVKTTRSNGLKLSYIEAAQGPLVILMHGFPDNARTWEETMLRLAQEGFRAVAPFNRGYYPTDVAADGDYSVASMARDVLGLIAALGARTAILI